MSDQFSNYQSPPQQQGYSSGSHGSSSFQQQQQATSSYSQPGSNQPPVPSQIPSPSKSNDVPLPYTYNSTDYMADHIPNFKHSSEATLTVHGSLFGISAVEINVNGFDIRGSGSIAISQSGQFWGRLQYNNYDDVGAPEQRYQLVCQQVEKEGALYIYFLQPPDMTPKAMFVGQVPSSTSREFSGVFQFN